MLHYKNRTSFKTFEITSTLGGGESKMPILLVDPYLFSLGISHRDTRNYCGKYVQLGCRVACTPYRKTY